jgi:hypothetical protein
MLKRKNTIKKSIFPEKRYTPSRSLLFVDA